MVLNNHRQRVYALNRKSKGGNRIMTFCRQCGQQIQDKALFCVAYGSPQGSAEGQQTTGPAGSLDFKVFGNKTEGEGFSE